MKRKINALAVAVFIALSALIPAGCSNAENTVSENPSENSVVEAQETSVEISYLFNDDQTGEVSVIPNEKAESSKSSSEENSLKSKIKKENSQPHSENDNTALPSTPSAASDTSEMHKEPSEKAMEYTQGSYSLDKNE